MIEIKCMKNIEELSVLGITPKAVVDMLKEELIGIKNWSDEDNEYTIDDFNTDYFNYGHIVILDGSETEEEIKKLGLTEGLEGVVPEAAVSHYIDNEKWTRIIVVYNDSYSMSFWLKNSNIFDSYEIANMVSNGNSSEGNSEPF